ncbi:MAG: radical SAM protein, partial [Thermodesulfovibrio sp.]|nr:radical SAM protein [Thermodesulfovibrio sp.]
MGKKIRTRSPEKVVEEIEYLVSKFGIEEIHFWDDNITFDKEHIINLCREIKRAGLHKKIVWACSNGVRLDRLDEEIIKEMESAGCYYFLVGIESGSERVLKIMKRASLANTKTIQEKLDMIKKHSKIRVLGAFIIGFPGATPEDDEESIKFALKLPLDKVAFNIFMPYPGSDEFNKLKFQGIKINIDELNYHKPKAYLPPGRTSKDIRLKVLKGLFLFYIRPKILIGVLKEIKSLSQIIMIIRRLIS